MLFSIPADSMKGGRKYKDGMALFKLLVHLLDQTIEDKIRICFVICMSALPVSLVYSMAELTIGQRYL